MTIGEVAEMVTPRKPLRPETVRAFRERRGWTHEQMADVLWVSPPEVAAWEAGTVRVPPEAAQRMRWMAAYARRSPGIGPPAAPLPSCAWADAHAPGLHEILWYQPEKVAVDVQVQAHLHGCPHCSQALALRGVTAAQKALPEPGLEDPVANLLRNLLALPRPLLYPVLIVGGFGLAMAVAGLVHVLLLVVPDLPSPTDGAAAFGWAVWAGFMAWITAKIFANSMRLRPYAQGLLRALAAVGAGMGTAWLNGAFDHLDAALLAGAALLVLVLGAATGAYTRWKDADDDADAADPARPSAAPATPAAPGTAGVPSAGQAG